MPSRSLRAAIRRVRQARAGARHPDHEPAGPAPDIQEEFFFLPPVTEGRPVVTERHLRQVLKTPVWSKQRERWAAIRAVQ
jgi:hypothetical protein